MFWGLERWLTSRTLVAFSETLGSIPSTHMEAHNRKRSSSEYPTSGFCEFCMYTVHTCKQNSHTHNITFSEHFKFPAINSLGDITKKQSGQVSRQFYGDCLEELHDFLSDAALDAAAGTLRL